jgi:anti-sigma B factor antagonist
MARLLAAEDLLMPEPAHRLKVKQVGDVTVIYLRRIQKAIGDQVFNLVDTEGRRKLLINWRKVELISSATLGRLISLHKKLPALGGRMVLCNLSEEMYELFEIVRLEQFFDIRKNEKAGFAAFSCPPATNMRQRTTKPDPRQLCKAWREQCQAARGIEDEFGTPKALSYLIGEKFLNFLEIAEDKPDFRAQIPAFIAEIKTIFERWQLAEYLETARQEEPFDPGKYDEEDEEDEDYDADYEDGDAELLEMLREEGIRQSANDLLLVERAREWLLE